MGLLALMEVKPPPGHPVNPFFMQSTESLSIKTHYTASRHA